MLIRIIQSSFTNALYLWNIDNESKNKMGSKKIAMSVAKNYLSENN